MQNKPDPVEIEKDLKDIAELASIGDSKGGKILVDNIVTDVVGTINKLSDSCSTLTQQEFIAYCSLMKANLDLLRAITRAKANKEYLEELLAEALKQ
jgi:hypothetical protein